MILCPTCPTHSEHADVTNKSEKPSSDEVARVIIRLDRDLHRQMKCIAAMNEVKVNDLIDDVIRREIKAWESVHGLKVNDLMAKTAANRK
jgi:hypothetical protein